MPAPKTSPDADPTELTELTFRPFSYGEYRAALRGIKESDDDARFEALASLATGQPVDVLDLLKRPDYVSLSQHVHTYVTKTSAHYMGEPSNLNAPKLLVPLNVGGEVREGVTLQMPALKAVKVMKKIENGDKRAEWITSHCAGLMGNDVFELSVPDWNLLQERINHFLNQPAAFFQSETLT